MWDSLRLAPIRHVNDVNVLQCLLSVTLVGNTDVVLCCMVGAAAGEGDETDEEERDGSSTSGSDSERELMEVEERRGEQWDCESILR